jgi:hypothetical protein
MFSATKRHEFREAWRYMHRAAMWTLDSRHIEAEFHLMDRLL